MKRRELLELNLTEEKNVKSVVDSVLSADQKFIKRAKRDLEDSIEDLEESFKERLSSNVALDKSVVENLYSQLQEKKALLSLYKSFESEYLA